MRSLGVVERLAVRALARTLPVVLGEGDDASLGRFPQPLLHTLGGEVAQLRVGQAKLRVVRRALAFDEAEPFRVFREMLVREDERVECVDETFVADAAAQF